MKARATPSRLRTYALRGVECVLLAGGLAALVYCAGNGLKARAAEQAADALVASNSAPVHSARATSDPISIPRPHPPSDVIGRISIPQLRLSAPITTGVGKTELIEGVGHIPGTAEAGGLGTMGLAGHRDTFFRPLSQIAKGMEIHVTGEDGTYSYQVDSTRIVTPEQVEVLETGSEPRLILVTCFPFHYIGAAPKRFIVQAHLVSLIPDAQ